MDIWGVDGAAAEAEALAAMVSFMESVGLTSDDVGIKVNSRAVLAELLARTCGVDAAADAARFAACCVLVDKLEKVPPEALHGDFGALGVAAADVDALAAVLRERAADVDALAAVLRDAADAGGSLAALEALIGDGPALSNLRALVDLAETSHHAGIASAHVHISDNGYVIFVFWMLFKLFFLLAAVLPWAWAREEVEAERDP